MLEVDPGAVLVQRRDHNQSMLSWLVPFPATLGDVGLLRVDATRLRGAPARAWPRRLASALGRA